MNIPSFRNTAVTAMGLCFLIISGAMARYYLTYDEKNDKLREETKTRIMDRLSSRWLKPDLRDVSKQFSEGPLDNFDMIIINAAMGRWRVREIAPHGYPRLISDFRNGWWDDSFVNGLTPLLTEMDREWKVERINKALSRKSHVSPELVTAGDVGFGILFPPGTASAQIGSLIEILLTVDPGSNPQDYATALWSTKQNPDLSPWRSKRCALVDTKETTGGLPIYRISIDMSACPEWISTSTEPTAIHFRGNPPVKWSPYAFTLKDSPLLRVELDNDSKKGLLPDSK